MNYFLDKFISPLTVGVINLVKEIAIAINHLILDSGDSIVLMIGLAILIGTILIVKKLMIYLPAMKYSVGCKAILTLVTTIVLSSFVSIVGQMYLSLLGCINLSNLVPVEVYSFIELTLNPTNVIKNIFNIKNGFIASIPSIIHIVALLFVSPEILNFMELSFLNIIEHIKTDFGFGFLYKYYGQFALFYILPLYIDARNIADGIMESNGFKIWLTIFTMFEFPFKPDWFALPAHPNLIDTPTYNEYKEYEINRKNCESDIQLKTKPQSAYLLEALALVTLASTIYLVYTGFGF